MVSPTTRDHDFDNIELAQLEDASTQVTAFLANCFLRKRFFKDASLRNPKN